MKTNCPNTSYKHNFLPLNWSDGVCTDCEYICAHSGGEADCQNKAKCEVCGEAYGELNADNHTKEAEWTITGEKHSKTYECCGKVVVAEAAHKLTDGKCKAATKRAYPRLWSPVRLRTLPMRIRTLAEAVWM